MTAITYIGISDEVEQQLPDGTFVKVKRGDSIDTTADHANKLAEGESWSLDPSAAPIEAENVEPELEQPAATKPEQPAQKVAAGQKPAADAAESAAEQAEEGDE